MKTYFGMFEGEEVPVTHEEANALIEGTAFVVTTRHAPVEKLRALRDGRAHVSWNPRRSPEYGKKKEGGQFELPPGEVC